MYTHNNHCHRVTAHLQLNILFHYYYYNGCPFYCVPELGIYHIETSHSPGEIVTAATPRRTIRETSVFD
jgi:hypothetical protein